MAPVIVVHDNDSSFLSLMHELLTEEGYEPLLWHAYAHPDLHAFLRRMQSALVILDLWIERCDDGWELLKRLWADVETTHIPAVIVTEEPAALPVRADLLRAMRCEVVRKPFDLPDLLAAIATVLGPSPASWRGGARTAAASRGAARVGDGPAAAFAALPTFERPTEWSNDASDDD